jgi:hypothetical protein
VNNRRALPLSPLWFIVALLTLIASSTPSAAASSGPETRVRAFDTPTENSVGQHSSETAGDVGCVRPESADLAVGSCVATKSAPTFRGGSRPPSQIFDEGFQPVGSDRHLLRHAEVRRSCRWCSRSNLAPVGGTDASLIAVAERLGRVRPPARPSVRR